MREQWSEQSEKVMDRESQTEAKLDQQKKDGKRVVQYVGEMS